MPKGMGYNKKSTKKRGKSVSPKGGHGNTASKSKTAAGRSAKKGNTRSKFTY